MKVCYRSKLKREEADIVANGRRTLTFVASGVKFRCQNPDRSIVLFDNSLSEQFYSYLVVNDHVGEIACVNPVGCRHVQQRLRQTIRRFESVLHMEIHGVERRFSSVVSFGFPRRAGPVHPLEVGEAAGFQDHLAGFGMVYAFRSGYDAAKSIAEHLDYDRLWRKDFSRQLWISSMNRKVYRRLSNRHFEGLIRLLASRNPAVRALIGGDDLRLILKKAFGIP